MNILLVDDDVTTLQRLKNDVHWQRMHIRNQYCASSVAMAQAILETHSVQLLLCDIEMPMENGLQLIKWVRSRHMDIACLILTAHARFAFAQEAVSLGAVSYILKPLDIEQVEQEIEKVLATRKNDGYFSRPAMSIDEDNAPLVQKIVMYLQDHYTEDFNAAALAVHFNYNADYLTRIFKKQKQLTPLEYLTRYRLEKSCALLRYGDLSISEIAMLVGFNSSSYYSTLFKLEYGISPVKYRKTQSQSNERK